MKTPFTALVFGLLTSMGLLADGSWFGTIPEDLRVANLPVLSDDQNALFLAVAQVPQQNEAEAKRWRDELKGLQSAQISQDADLIKQAEEIHARTERLSRMPSRFSTSVSSPPGWGSALFRLFRAEELLARQAALQGDRAKMDLHVDTLLAWNRSLREARPNLIGWAVTGIPWTTAFDVLLADWQNHPDQEARLKEIAARFEKARVRRSELTAVLQADLATVVEMGPLPEMLRGWDQSGISLLKPPFDEVPLEKVLALPYDQKATIAETVAGARQALRDAGSTKPFVEWAYELRTVPARTLEDYRKMPNGMFRLIEEQMDHTSSFYVMGGAEIQTAQLETCLRWLAAERSGKEFTSTDPLIAKDPMNGQPLRVRVKERLIQSVGSDFQPNENDAVPARVGFHRALRDPALRVPAWR